VNRSKDLINARWAVIAFFAVNGFLYANWTARIPEIESFYDISHTQLGSLLLTIAIGSVVAMPFAGYLNNKVGSKRITMLGGFFACIIGPFMVFAPYMPMVYFIGFLIGAAGGTMDVSMNGQAVIVERDWGKTIMSSFHATFSIGMVAGAGIGALAAKFEIPLYFHLLIVDTIGLILLIIASRYLIDDYESTKAASKSESGFVFPTAAILPVAVIAFCGMTGEGSMVDWSALYMNEVTGASTSISALAFGTFGASMTIGRLLGDGITNRIGSKRMLLYGSVLSFLGLLIAIVFPNTITTFIGFFITGLGLSNIVPIAYSLAGNTPNVKPAVGIAMATTIGYSGFFVGPPIIGYLADVFDLRIALCFTLVLFAVMFGIILMRKSTN